MLSRIDEIHPNIIAVTELIPKNLKNYCRKEFSIPDYDMFTNMDKNQQRGVALYTSSKLNARECYDFDDFNYQESTWCTFDSECNGKVLIGCVYRNPNSSTDDNNKKLFEILKSDRMLKYDKICIMGDFNYPNVKWDGTWSGDKSNDIIKQIHDAFLIQKVVKETRRRPLQTPTLDDWILVNDDSLISEVIHLDPLGKSDHDVLFFQLNLDKQHKTDKVEYKYNLSKGDYDAFRNTLKEYKWSKLVNMDVQDSWNYIKDILHEGMEKFIPKIKLNKKKKFTPIWMNKKATRCIKKKYNLYKKYLSTKSGTDYMKYIKERNKCSKLLKVIKKDYEKEVAKNSKANPKVFWKYVQNKLKVNTSIGALNKPDGSLAVSDKEKADTLNNFFAGVFTREDKSDIPHLEECIYSSGIALSEVRITPKAVYDKLLNLNPNKAQGPDHIPSRILKELANEISEPLCILFNKSIETGILPQDWKLAEVTALFKKGSKADPSNYRPVSLTSIACKVLESLVRDSIVAHFSDCNLYAKCQHGFRKKRSCVTQLLEVIEDISKLLDDGFDIDVLYLDFKKAFDTVPHERLIVKLLAYGISGSVLNWIKGFLSDRFQTVRVGDEKSEIARVLSGIPQGSILGPVLFTIFINDLPISINSTCKIFADDTKLYNIASSSALLQDDIYKLQEWSNIWNLYFNVSKCGVLHFGKNNQGNKYYMKVKDSVEQIKDLNEEKDLGVIFDNKLSFDTHIGKIVNKANQMLGIIRRSFSYLDKDVFLKLYKSFVRPHLEYANAIWFPYLKRQSSQIERVQRRATKILKECKNKTYEERLEYLNLHSLKGRRIRGDLIQTYKIFNGIDDVPMDSLFPIAQYTNTRNADSKIFIRHCRTNKRKFSFSNRVAPLWNNLPSHHKFAQNINQFKNLLDDLPNFKKMFKDFDT